jgi:hypothetical protein
MAGEARTSSPELTGKPGLISRRGKDPMATTIIKA